MPNVFFVTQGQAYEFESRDRYIWAPITSKASANRFYWRNVELVKKDDVIIHHAGAVNGGISAISQATTDFYYDSIPKELRHVAEEKIGTVGAWEDEGRRVDCDYVFLRNKMPIKIFKETILKFKDYKFSAFNRNGGVNQGYLYELEEPIAYAMIKEAVNLNPYLKERQFIVDILKTLLL